MGKTKKLLIKGLAGILLASAMVCSPPRQLELPLINYKKQDMQIETENMLVSVPETSYLKESLDNSIENKKKILSREEINKIAASAYNKINSRKKIPPYMPKKFFEESVIVESSGDVYAVSKAGAKGLMQIREVAWNQVDASPYSQVFDPDKNVNNGIKYYLWIDTFCARKHPNWSQLSDDEKKDILHAAFNLGANKLEKLGWNYNTILETRTHVARLDSLSEI